MLALSLLLAVTAAADPAATAEAPATPARPETAATEAASAEATRPAAPAAEAQPQAVADEPEAPAAPFVLDGFVPPEQAVGGAAVRLGGSGLGLEAAVDALARWHGAIAGVTVSTGGTAADGVRNLGLVVGYGHARGLYRGEALLGWGLASDRRDLAGAPALRSGHHRSLQVGLDRVVLGGEGWRATVGAALWWRATFGLAGAPAGHDEVGGGVRIGGELGLAGGASSPPAL